MRQIKFRVWGPNSKYMWEWEELQHIEMRWLVDGEEDSGDRIIMQSIGLTDKNGKEIYESDIITADIIEYNSLMTQGEIVYDNELSMYSNKNEAGLTPLYKLNNIEIIGNIYENPELLEA